MKLEELRKRKEYITERKHPTEDLLIWNYNNKCQYDSAWDEYTEQARGLITDSKGVVISRPFRKFYNLEEHQYKIPSGIYDIYHKLDGSLGISYWIGDEVYLATRGSFESDQAIKGTEILRTKDLSELKKDKTYLFEIIYPSNRIVVDYKNLEDVVLLAVIDTKTGIEDDIDSYKGFTVAKRYPPIAVKQLKELSLDNAEGFVVRWDNGFRIKVKFAEYMRLHKLLTGFNSRRVWEILKEEEKLESYLDRVPDEFYNWIKETELTLTKQFTDIKKYCENKLKNVINMKTRKEQAEKIVSTKYPEVIFAMLDKKENTNQLIWRRLKPKHEEPFKIEI